MQQVFRPLRVGAGEHGEASLRGDEVGDRDRRLLGVEFERDPVLGLARLEAVERPVSRLDGVLLVTHRLGHVDAVGDARRVGDHERRPGPGVGLEQGLGRLQVVGADGDLGHVDVAVGPGDGAEVLLAAGLAGGGELGHGASRRRLGRLTTSVRVHLRVEHEDVDVAPRRQHVVEAAEADVVGPPVAADDPHTLAGEAAGERQQVAGGLRTGAVAGGEWLQRLAQRGDPLTLGADADLGPLVGGEDRVDEVRTDGAGHPLEQRGGEGRLRLQTEAQAEPELGVVLEQRVAPRRAATLVVDGPRRRRQVAAVDRRAAGGVGDHHAVAEQLGGQLDVRRLAAAGAGTGELEQRLQGLRALDRVVRQQVAVELGDGRGRSPSSAARRRGGPGPAPC